MLPKQYRLPREDVSNVLKHGRRLGVSPLVYTSKFSPSNTKRFAILVSAKSTKLATDRNHIKRLIREAVRKYIELVKPGHDIVFRWTGSAKDISNDLICNLVTKAFQSL